MNIAKIERNVKQTMKARAKQDEAPTVVGSPVDLASWKAEFVKADEGKEQTAIQKYLSENAGTPVTDEAGRVTALKTEHILSSIEVAKLKIDEKPFAMEFVANTALTAYGRMLLCNGVDDLTVDAEGNEVPSVTKYFNTAFSQNARNAAAARVRTIVEGPEKALNAAAKKLAQVWGITVEAAAAKIAAMAEQK